jgi:uncharacterized repeat protein (TIGR03809 family)
MTHRFGAAHDSVVVARWCALAEQRLDYLTELFNNGRWRRYYSHTAFLENIKEAKAMVAHWRALSTPGYVPERPTPILIPELKPASVPDVVETASSEIEPAAASEAALADEVVAAPAQDLRDKEMRDKEMRDKKMQDKEMLHKEMPDKMPSPADLMQDRYSLLRNLTQ